MSRTNLSPDNPLPKVILVANIKDVECSYLAYYNNLQTAIDEAPRTGEWMILSLLPVEPYSTVEGVTVLFLNDLQSTLKAEDFNEGESIIVRDGVFVGESLSSYYMVTSSQGGTDAPVIVDVLVPAGWDTDNNPVMTRGGTGLYTATFESGQNYMLENAEIWDFTGEYMGKIVSNNTDYTASNVVEFFTYDTSDVLSDGILNFTIMKFIKIV